MFHMGSVLQITSRWFNLLRSACTLNHLTDGRQGSKLDQFVTVQCSVVINNHAISIHETTRINDGSRVNSNMPLFRGRLLHYVDTSRTSNCGDKLPADRTFHSWYILLCYDMFIIVIYIYNLHSPSVVNVTHPPNTCLITKNIQN
jgi:hypothetical protein